jgi:hypothetical protein
MAAASRQWFGLVRSAKSRTSEADVVNTYRLWLVYELFRGAITAEQLAFSEAQTTEFIRTRKADNPHLSASFGCTTETLGDFGADPWYLIALHSRQRRYGRKSLMNSMSNLAPLPPPDFVPRRIGKPRSVATVLEKPLPPTPLTVELDRQAAHGAGDNRNVLRRGHPIHGAGQLIHRHRDFRR